MIELSVMLIHDICVFKLQIETNFQCLVFVVIKYIIVLVLLLLLLWLSLLLLLNRDAFPSSVGLSLTRIIIIIIIIIIYLALQISPSFTIQLRSQNYDPKFKLHAVQGTTRKQEKLNCIIMLILFILWSWYDNQLLYFNWWSTAPAWQRSGFGSCSSLNFQTFLATT